jgi:hypothetical protein
VISRPGSLKSRKLTSLRASDPDSVWVMNIVCEILSSNGACVYEVSSNYLEQSSDSKQEMHMTTGIFYVYGLRDCMSLARLRS